MATHSAPTTTSRTARVVRTAIANHHVIGNAGFRALDVSRTWVKRNVDGGLLTPVGWGTYVVGLDPERLPRDTCAMIAILRTSTPAALGLQSAMERLGYWSRGPADLHVVSTGRTSEVITRLSAALDVHVHRVRRLDVDDLVLVDRVPVTGALATIPSLGRQLTPHQVAHVIWNALYEEAIDLDALAIRLDAARFVPGSAAVRQALELVVAGSCGTKSRSEDEVVALIRYLRIPMPLVNQLGSAGLPGVRLDFVWPEQRVVLELDGRHHLAMPGIAASDRAVFDALRSQGWRTIRMHYSRIWNEPFAVADVLTNALAA